MAERLGQIEGRLDDIDRALGQLDDGTYGACRSCGRAMSGDHLETEPTALLCVACQAASGGSGPPRGE